MGVLIVAAAGNQGNSVPVYPASYPTVMSIGSVDSDKNIADFSQHNTQVELSAPGVDILSTSTSQKGTKFTYREASGTGYAVPHVSGIAMKLWSHYPSCSNRQMRNVLLRSSMDRGSTGCDEYYGYGIVQAKVAFDLLSTKGCDAGGLSDTAAAIGGCNQLPDTVSPTPSPTLTSPPTSQVPCKDREGDFVTVTLSLQTDDFGTETSWKIYSNDVFAIDNDGGNVVLESPESGYDSDTLYVEEYCVPRNVCTFVMFDSFGKFPSCSEQRPSVLLLSRLVHLRMVLNTHRFFFFLFR